MIDEKKLLSNLNDKSIEITFDIPVEEVLGEDVDLDDFAMLVQGAVQAYRKMVLDVISSQPKVGEWIPCSERLPDKYIHCLVTRRNEYEDGFDTDVREDTYVELEGVWQWQSKAEGLIDDVIAWRELPDPYREDEDEKQDN